MISPAAWILIPVALDQQSWAHPLHRLALRIDLAHGNLSDWPELKVRKPKWEN